MFDYDSLQVLGFDVGATKIAGGVVSYPLVSYSQGVYTLGTEAPRVLAFDTIPTNARRGGAAVLQTLTDFIRSYIDTDRDPLVGIGIASSGIVNPQSGNISYANDLMPDWTGQPLRSFLEQHIGLPVRVLGDVQGHALGEVRWGAARGTYSSICVAAGTGLGGAFAADGKVLLGVHGAAGHLGHTLHPRTVDMTCACGQRGHVETLASGTGISSHYQGVHFGAMLDPARMGDYIVKQAEAGEEAALETLELAGFVLGESIGSWCNLFDPEMVVLSGSVSLSGDRWFNALKQGFASQAIGMLKETPIVFAQLGGKAPIVGGAEFLLDHLVDQGTVVRTAS